MSTLLRLITSFGEQVVTVRGMRDRLADINTFPDIVERLLLEEQVSIDLKDGGTATLLFADSPSAQANPLTRYQVPRHDYEARVNLCFEIPASIECGASSRAEAQYLIQQVLRGQIARPSDFTVRLSDEDVGAFMARFDAADGRPERMGITDYSLTDLRERLLITRQDLV